MPVKLRSFSNRDFTLKICCRLDAEGAGRHAQYSGELALFRDDELQTGPQLVCLQVGDVDKKALQELCRLNRIIKTESLPVWHLNALKQQFRQKSTELASRYGVLLVQVSLPKTSHPLRLEAVDQDRQNFGMGGDTCTVDLMFSQRLSVIKRVHKRPFSLLRRIEEAKSKEACPSVSELRLIREVHVHSVGALSPEKANLLWNHRHFLGRRFPALLPAFIKSVQWWLAATDRAEIDEALRVIGAWKVRGRTSLCLPVLEAVASGEVKADGVEWVDLMKRLIHDPEWLVNYFMESIVSILPRLPESLRVFLHDLIVAQCQDSHRLQERLYWLRVPLSSSLHAAMLDEQRRLLNRIDELMVIIQGESTTKKRLEKLQHLLSDPNRGMLHLNPPVRVPGVYGREEVFEAVSVLPDRCAVFKSTATCVLITFVDATYSKTLRIIYKRGDDLQRDASMLRMFRLCARLWQESGVEELIPERLFYGVVPVGEHSGMVEFVESKSIAALLSTADKREHDGPGNADADDEVLHGYFKDSPAKLDAFVRSCAGYSVLTYVFGIGDRHLDNLLLTPEGHVLHIDYAYRYGADPKPFPPPIKLAREMVSVMMSHAGRWMQFKRLCRVALWVLQTHAALITSAVAIADEASAVEFVRERLMTGEDAFDALIEESRRAFFPQVMEALHKWAQYWKA